MAIPIRLMMLPLRAVRGMPLHAARPFDPRKHTTIQIIPEKPDGAVRPPTGFRTGVTDFRTVGHVDRTACFRNPLESRGFEAGTALAR